MGCRSADLTCFMTEDLVQWQVRVISVDRPTGVGSTRAVAPLSGESPTPGSPKRDQTIKWVTSL